MWRDVDVEKAAKHEERWQLVKRLFCESSKRGVCVFERGGALVRPCCFRRSVSVRCEAPRGLRRTRVYSDGFRFASVVVAFQRVLLL
jgi:hypothetical protein